VRVTLYVQRDAKGRPIKNPKGIEVDLALDKDKAYAFADTILVRDVHRAKVIGIYRDGLIIEGAEPFGEAYRYQEWWCRPVDGGKIDGSEILEWAVRTFGPIATDRQERARRLLEEA